MSGTVTTTFDNEIQKQVFEFNDWRIETTRSHILESKCKSKEHCDSQPDAKDTCLFCQYEAQLHLPHFPDMTFANNLLRIVHTDGYGLEFKALNALQEVKDRCLGTTISVTEDWLKARENCEYARQVKNNFDWTYSTFYNGHLISKDEQNQITIEPTDQSINLDKLRVQEEILFFDEIDLFEDELADNGVAKLNLKIRVMPEKFFILLRYFLRVDKVKIKIHDTRYYYEVGQDYILKEFTIRECNEAVINRIPVDIQLDPVELAKKLPLSKIVKEKLILPLSS